MTGVDDRVANNTEGERSNSGLSPFCACFSEWSKMPFLLGVIVHATYIVLRMSSETRWTWYYTSWIFRCGSAGASGFCGAGTKTMACHTTAAVLVLLLAGGG